MKKLLTSSAAAAILAGVITPYYVSAANPYLPLWEHLPDGEPRVFEDPDNPGKYRIYIIGSHDVRFTDYCGVDIRVWSAPVDDLTNWRDDGAIFTYEDPLPEKWDIMFAPDMVEVLRRDENGERTIREYYLYPHSRGPGREPLVAKGTRPDGPFEPINLSLNGRTVEPGSIMGFDPSVYIEYIDDPADPDYDIGFRAYGYWGFQRSFAAELDQNTMYSVKPGKEVINYFIPASNSYGDIRDPAGTKYPHVFPGEDLGSFNFFEAASIRKVGNKFVWVYSGYSGPDYGLGSTNSTLRYAYGDSPLGPWRSGGVLVDSRAVVQNEDGSALMTSYSGHNTHGSIEKIGDQWFVFYHRAPRGFGYARQPMVAPVHITWDEASVAQGGKVTIKGQAAPGKALEVSAGGYTYSGAEVTSEGFCIDGLYPYRYYSAGIACYLSNHSLQADAWDIWDDHAPLKKVSNGDIIGFKYFGFGKTAQDSPDAKEIKGTALNLYLMPLTQRECKIEIWLDGPFDNSVWNGKKIGEITVPDSSSFEVTKYSADLSAHLDNAEGKHAIYLKADGIPGNLFDLIGLGFTADGLEIERPIVPVINITADGAPLKLPAEPVRADETNGLTGYNLYEIEYELAEKTRWIPAIEAESDNADVKINITQADENGIATASFDYKGAVKTYQIVFAPLSNLVGNPDNGNTEQTPSDTEVPEIPPYPPVQESSQNQSDIKWEEYNPPAAQDGADKKRLAPILGGIAGAVALVAGLYYLFRGKEE